MHPAIRGCVWIVQVGLVACAKSPRPPPTAPPPRLEVAALSRITGLSLDGDLKGEPDEGTVRTSLRIKLLGTLLSVDPAWSIASLLDLGRQKSRTVMVGDQLEDFRALEIFRDRVILVRHGRREVIDLAPTEGIIGPAGDWPTRSARTGGAIRALDESHYEVPRTEVERALNHLDELARDVRIAPAFSEGQPRGVRVLAIRPGSLLAEIGIRDGDLLRRINGFEMNTAENALEAYARLRSASRLDVELERDGSSIRRSYSIR